MRVWLLNASIVLVALCVWCLGGSQRERPAFAEGRASELTGLELSVAQSPQDSGPLLALATAYLVSDRSGLAVSAIERAPAHVRGEPAVLHLYARALGAQGLAREALFAEREVVRLCDLTGACSNSMRVWAARRVQFLEELTRSGVEDWERNPEAASVAYAATTRQARIGF